jgi:WASH complex subunit 7
MRQLAEQKYGLELDNLHLPCQTLEQGVDVLEIMRNIHIFVASYTYNLNTQVFIERMTNASYRKHINTISVNHVANSIRTHGTGIISTTVNFTYQYLSHKFISFSQFLFDDHIKSRLVKERRFFKETKGNERQEYPVARAQKLNLEIRKLGITESGQSYLDQFRQLIAEMGNALGFVRMVRLGGLSYCSATSGYVQFKQSSLLEIATLYRFVYALQYNTEHSFGSGSFVQEGKNISFELASKDLGMSPETIQAGKLLDTALETQNMSLDGTNYFNILVNVFSQELQSDGNVHLKDFFLVVPALMISAIEAMLQAKDKLFKRSRTSADSLFTDDGFVLGIAYLLKVLGQDKQFDSLHWFESARKHYRAEKARLEEGLDTDSNTSGLPGLQIWSQKLASISDADVQNMQLAVKRVASYLMELELTDYNLTGARIFFL